MKSILVIGTGDFGGHLTRKLVELGNEVMIVDINEDHMRELLPLVRDAQIADCTQEDVLHSLGVGNFDICFVCVGENFQSCLEITSLLKDLGAKYVISKAKRDIHKKFLLRNGADEVTYPERDIAEKLAVRHSASNLFDYFELTKEISIYEIPALKAWIGKSIKELNFRTKYNISILATKKEETVVPLPSPDYVFKEDEHLMVMGHHLDVEKILRQIF